MKRSKWLFIMVIIMTVVLAACGKEETNSETPEFVEVELETEPGENLQPNEEFTIKATVTQGGEPVDDADEVRFEFWRDGATDDEHESINGEFQGDGVYIMEKTVAEPGIYYVISHVTARDMHTMPKKELVIGDVEKHSEESENVEHGDHGQSQEESHDHGDSSHGLAMHIMVDDVVELNEETPLVGHIQVDGHPLQEANVEFEIWHENAEKHEYVPATEGNEGEYNAVYTFVESGVYHINLHVEKDELHDHKEITVTVE